MLKTPYFIAIFVLLAALSPACTQHNQDKTSCQNALEALDGVLAQEDELAQIKESRMAKMRHALEQTGNDYERYLICDNLFDEYFRYNMDSAITYAYLKVDIARRIGSSSLLNDALLDKSRRDLTSGMYHKSMQILSSIDTLTLTQEQKATYYQEFNSIYHGLASTVKDPFLKADYEAQEEHYRQISLSFLTEDMLGYYTVKAGILIEEGKTEEAREIMSRFESTHKQTIDNQSIIHYWLAKAYRAEGNKDKALEEFATSARLDFIGPYKASRSLVQAAILLLEKGDIVRSYNYITRNYRDAIEADARICLDEISDFMPEIITSYERREHKRMNQLKLSLSFTILLLVVSVLALIIVRRLQTRISRANQEIRQINNSLADNVEKLKEANSIKDSYLGRYLYMFSNHINSLERYRSSLRGVAKSMNLQEILQALRSDDFIDQEREILYEEFDHTFLGVFPDFVEQLNSLLEPDKRIGENLPEGKLTNELRIFALIRLGVNESGKIAQFLRKSPSTIYNYRVKLRNCAVCGGEEFEKRLMEIGQN